MKLRKKNNQNKKKNNQKNEDQTSYKNQLKLKTEG